MNTRVIPKAYRPTPINAFEWTMTLGRNLPGRFGHMCNRKLKRRLCARMDGSFYDVLADTGAGDLCLDLGANKGEFTLKMGNTGAEVIAFEPDPVAFGALRKACGDMGNVTLHQKAVSTEDTQMLLRRDPNWTEKNALAHTVSSSIVHHKDAASETQGEMVDVVDLTRFLSELDRDIRIIKMDIEGAEWGILDALLGHPVLERIDTLFVETHERWNPARCRPLFEALQDKAEALERPYINLYWS